MNALWYRYLCTELLDFRQQPTTLLYHTFRTKRKPPDEAAFLNSAITNYSLLANLVVLISISF